jgi:hypothetical protein
MNNPIDILNEHVGFFELTSRFYLVRPLVGKLNATLIGQARSILRDRTPTVGGIDDPLIGRMRIAQTTKEPIWGFDERPDPRDTIAAVTGLKHKIIEMVDPTDEFNMMSSIRGTLDDLRGTIEFLTQPREILLNDKLIALAKQLCVNPSQLQAAMQDDSARNAERLMNDKHELLGIIDEFGSDDIEFEALPINIQIGISESLDKTIASSLQNAIRTVMRPTNRIGDIPVLQTMNVELTAWREHTIRTNPDFAMQLLGIG